MDMGLPGPDRGQGGKHLLVPPGYEGEVPEGYYAAMPTTNRQVGLVRALPPHGRRPGRDRADEDDHRLPAGPAGRLE
jgi:hypothetical protein